MDIHGLSDENFNAHAYDLLSSVFEIDDLKLRLAFIHQKRMDLLDLLAQREPPYSDEQLQMLQADEIALGMLERAYLDSLANEDLSCFTEIIEDMEIDAMEEVNYFQNEASTANGPEGPRSKKSSGPQNSFLGNNNVQHISQPQNLNTARSLGNAPGKAIPS